MAMNGAILDNMKHKCESLKPGAEYVIQMTQKELDGQFKKVIEWAGCDIEISQKNGKPIVKIVKQKESDEDLLWEWWIDGLLWDIKESADKDTKQYHKQVVQKEKHVKTELARTQWELARTQWKLAEVNLNYLSVNYEDTVVDSFVYIFRKVFKEKTFKINDIKSKLDKILVGVKWMKANHFMSMTEEEYKERMDNLKRLKSYFKSYKNISKDERNTILDIIDQIEKILKNRTLISSL